MEEEKVILVTPKDKSIGLMPKLEAHKKAVLHRAFSIFIFNDNDELLLQQRALNKYHSPGLWTNTCCSHQRQGESNLEAGNRRLKEEMGIKCNLKELFWFVYKAPFDNGLTEHELDHVMIGSYNKNPVINIDEVAGYEWKTIDDVAQDIKINPGKYTVWFKIIFKEYIAHLKL